MKYLTPLVVVALIAGCCSLDENRKSRDAMLKTAAVLEAESNYIQETGVLDPVALATDEQGNFDKAACIEHSKMLALFEHDNFALAAALRAWAEGEDVQEVEPSDVDHEARCAP